MRKEAELDLLSMLRKQNKKNKVSAVLVTLAEVTVSSLVFALIWWSLFAAVTEGK